MSREQILEALRSNYPAEHIKEIQSFGTEDFSRCPEDVPGGILMIHPMEAKVHQDSIPLNAVSFLAICPIIGANFKDSDFEGKDLKIAEACPQFSAMPPSLKVASAGGEAAALAPDSRHWGAELGEDENAFVGVFKQTKGKNSTYYIAAQAGAPMAMRQLKEKVSKNPMTFNELLRDKDYSFVRYLAQRNVERLCYNAARALGVEIKHSMDFGSFQEHEYSGKPYKALPQTLQQVSTIQRVSENVGIFNRLTPVKGLATNHYVYGGPELGIAEFRMNGKAKGLALPAALPVTGNMQKAQPGIIGAPMVPEYHSMVDENFLDKMQNMGWKPTHMYNLTPVVIKVYDQNLKRTK